VSSNLSLGEQTFIDASLSLATGLDERETCAAILDAVERLFGARSSWILLHNPATDRLETCDVRGRGAESYADLELPCDHGIVGLAFTRGETVFVPDVTNEERWFNPTRVQQSGLRSAFTVPLVYHQLRLGVVGLDSPHFTADAPPTPAALARLRGLAAQAAVALHNVRLFREMESDRSRLRRLVQERRDLRSAVGHLRHEVRDARAFTNIIGESDSVREVLSQVQVVAPADTSVLVVGETGTGKELVARAIHDRSRRAANSFVAVNCAALPEALVEARCFSTKSAICHPRRKPSCCAYSRNVKFSGWAARGRFRSTCVSSLPPIRTSPHAWRKVAFDQTCSIA
jgi:formate hydrogenlyase transcriptional activator